MAFLLLGLIAMLAIVPPFIRGRLEESPLVSTRKFKRSMLEMAASVNPSNYKEALTLTRRKLILPPLTLNHHRGNISPHLLNAGNKRRPYKQSSGVYRTSSVIRRRRVYFILSTLVLITGMLALTLHNPITLVIFIASLFLLLLYAILVVMLVR